ncbi:MAG: sulfite exporter TauE/SafE family protein [Candidatus Tectimicrobiota bacterium]
MDSSLVLALLLSGALGVSLGLLGGGGSILAVPMLVYVAGVAARDAVAMSLAIVGTTSLMASVFHGRQGRLDYKVAAVFGGAGMVGAFIGAQCTHLVSDAVLLLLFAALMLVIGTLMLVRKPREAPSTRTPHPRNLPRVLLAGTGVGVVTGFLGVGGGFLIVPALVVFTDLPMHVAVGTSLLVIALNAAAGFVGHLDQGDIPLALTVAFTVAAVAGTFVGARVAGHIPAQNMRRLFAGFVMLVAFFMIGKWIGAVVSGEWETILLASYTTNHA